MLYGKKYGVVQDPEYGFWRLDPFPSNEELSQYYQSEYYDLIRKGGRAPDIRKFMQGGSEADQERKWFHATFYSDMASVFGDYAPMQRVLDIGCGTGEFISYLKSRQFDVVGIEPSSDAVAVAVNNGLAAFAFDLDEYLSFHTAKELGAYGVITMINVLEHVPNPLDLIEKCKNILVDDGLLCIKVPNDFNPLQIAANQQLGKRAWWIARPDHTHYFNFLSLKEVLNRKGFEVIHAQSEFPMEMFIFMGEDYVDNPELGAICHRKRVAFDLALPEEIRRSLYKSLAEAGIGRTCTIVAKMRR